MESSWQEGDKAIVYSDPLTEAKAEGEVVLMEKLESFESGLEYWRVVFLADAFQTTRAIKPKDQSHQKPFGVRRFRLEWRGKHNENIQK